MRKYLDMVRNLGKDEDGVVSFEYIIVATCIIVVVIAAFQGGGTNTISGALSAGIAKIITAMSALSS